MSDDWTNIDEILRRNVEPVPMTIAHLQRAYAAMSHAKAQPEIYIVPYHTWLMHEMAEPTFAYEYWTSHMEGDVEE